MMKLRESRHRRGEARTEAEEKKKAWVGFELVAKGDSVVS
jgi:hypothetical protein